MVARRTGVLTAFWVVMFAAVLPSLVGPPEVAAHHHTTLCKWDFPWPRNVNYYLYNSQYNPSQSPPQFSVQEVTRISYGSGTWSEANFNLYFTPHMTSVSNGFNQGYLSWVHRGTASNLPIGWVAVTYVWDIHGNRPTGSHPCNRDTGSPIRQFNIMFNQDRGYHIDCLASGNHCKSNNLYDFHNVAAHEFGHTFLMDESGDWIIPWVWADGHGSESTMFKSTDAGETKKRTLENDDRDAGWRMYGCRNGKSTYTCS